MKFKELIKTIEKDGWYMVRQKGSLQQYHHLTKKGTVAVAGKSSNDIPAGTLNSILKQAQLI